MEAELPVVDLPRVVPHAVLALDRSGSRGGPPAIVDLAGEGCTSLAGTYLVTVARAEPGVDARQLLDHGHRGVPVLGVVERIRVALGAVCDARRLE